MSRRVYILFLVAALGATLAAQDPFWNTKPPAQWTRKDCEKLLTDSPWARGWAPDRATVVVGGGQRAPYMTGPRVVYRAQLWSALPIRQAMARYAQLDPNYKSLPEAARKQQDEESSRFVAAQFTDTVVVQVLFWKSDPRWTEFWQSQTLATLKPIVSLASPRRQVAPVHFTPPTHDKPEMQFVFPRFAEGQPVFDINDGSLALRMDLPAFNPYLAQLVSITFDAKKMMLDGKLVY